MKEIRLKDNYYSETPRLLSYKLKNNLTTQQLGSVTNELFHAFWDTVFTKDPCCKWLRDLVLKEKSQFKSRNGGVYSKALEALEEGMSETINLLATQYSVLRDYRNRKKQIDHEYVTRPDGTVTSIYNANLADRYVNYNNSADSPLHAKDFGYRISQQKINRRTFLYTLFILHYGCKSDGLRNGKSATQNFRYVQDQVYKLIMIPNPSVKPYGRK